VLDPSHLVVFVVWLHLADSALADQCANLQIIFTYSLIYLLKWCNNLTGVNVDLLVSLSYVVCLSAALDNKKPSCC